MTKSRELALRRLCPGSSRRSTYLPTSSNPQEWGGLGQTRVTAHSNAAGAFAYNAPVMHDTKKFRRADWRPKKISVIPKKRWPRPRTVHGGIKLSRAHARARSMRSHVHRRIQLGGLARLLINGATWPGLRALARRESFRSGGQGWGSFKSEGVGRSRLIVGELM